MKKTLFLALIAMVGFGFSSCSDDPKQEIDTATLQAYRNGDVSRCFKFKECKRYYRENNHSNWGDVPSDLLGGGRWTDQRILFTQGMICTFLTHDPGFENTAKSMAMEVFEAYKKVTQEDPVILIATKFEIDSETNVMRVDNIPYRVFKMTETSLVLDSYIRELHPDDCLRYIYYFDVDEFPQEEIDRSISFSTEKDALLYIVDLARKQFGGTVDLNEIYSYDKHLDSRVIDLDQLEELINIAYGN